jgi:hypothetical protein
MLFTSLLYNGGRIWIVDFRLIIAYCISPQRRKARRGTILLFKKSLKVSGLDIGLNSPRYLYWGVKSLIDLPLTTQVIGFKIQEIFSRPRTICRPCPGFLRGATVVSDFVI